MFQRAFKFLSFLLVLVMLVSASGTAFSYTQAGQPEADANNDVFLPSVMSNAAPLTPVPGDFNKKAPFSGVTDEPLAATLTWGESTDAISYEVCYDTTNDGICSNWINVGNTTNTLITGLQPNTKYYWQVRAVNGTNTTYADLGGSAFWNFSSGSDFQILIPEGSFQMGCDADHNAGKACNSDQLPLHSVTLDAFYMDKYEVTNAQYTDCVRSGGCTYPENTVSKNRSDYFGEPAFDSFPILSVTWDQANSYCVWAGKRLPTEAEWEKAARGNTDTRPFPWGEASITCSLANYTNYDETPAVKCVDDTTETGSYPDGASPYGVMDMTGNVSEWVNDWYQDTYYGTSPSTNPTGPASGSSHVVRGGYYGSFNFATFWLNYRLLDSSSSLRTGIRCAESIPSSNQAPNAPFAPYPADGADQPSTGAMFVWTGTDPDGDTLTYDVYLEAGDVTPDVLVSDNQSTNSYIPAGLAADTTYYWQIVATDEHGATTYGPVWTIGAELDEMVLVPAGNFVMGCDEAHNDGKSCLSDELPSHTVTLNAYYIDKYEVTNMQYAQCVASGNCTIPSDITSHNRSSYYGNPSYANYPVIYVSWQNAMDYCAWANKRLPTEAEWEKAARGSMDTRPFPWGDTSPNLSLANYGLGSFYPIKPSPGDTMAVGKFANGVSVYGAVNMSGNVWEWASDWYDSGYYAISPASNPAGPISGSQHVIRGGGWITSLYSIRIVRRYMNGSSNDNIGFRCAANTAR